MKICRPAGALEQYSIYRHELGMNAPVMVMAKYPMVITKGNLYPALKHMISKDTMLGVNVKLNSRPELYMLDSIDLNLTVRFKPELVVRDNLTSIFNDLVAHQIPYEQENLPLWRVIVAEERYVILYFDHSIFDGNSGRLFHDNLLEYLRSDLNKPMSNDIDPSLALTSTKPLIPSMEMLTEAGPPKMFMLKLIFQEMIVSKIWPTVDPYCWTGASPSLPCKSNIAFRHISKDRSSEYLKLSRANSTSITGLFTATLLATIRSCIPESYVDSEKGTTNITYSIPINCRGRKPIENFKQLGNLVSAFSGKISVEETPTNTAILTLAQSIISRLREALATGEYKYIMGVLGYVISPAYLKDMMKKPRSSLVEVSNLGTFDSDEPFDESYFGQTCSSCGASYCMSLIGSINGSISVSLSAVDDDPEQLLSDFMMRLESLTA